MSNWQTGIASGYDNARANMERRWGCRIENGSNEHR